MTKQTKPPSESWLTIVFPQVQTVWAQPHSTSRVVFSTVSFSDQVEMLRVWGVKLQTLRRSDYKTSKSMGCVEAKVWHTLIVGLHWKNYCVTLDQSHFRFWGGLFTKQPCMGQFERFRHCLQRALLKSSYCSLIRIKPCIRITYYIIIIIHLICCSI